MQETMKTTASEMKTCPFCGGKPGKRSWNGKGYVIICQECGVETMTYDTPQEAIDAWNRRTGENHDKQ